jgi:hypothetical protein
MGEKVQKTSTKSKKKNISHKNILIAPILIGGTIGYLGSKFLSDKERTPLKVENQERTPLNVKTQDRILIQMDNDFKISRPRMSRPRRARNTRPFGKSRTTISRRSREPVRKSLEETVEEKRKVKYERCNQNDWKLGKTIGQGAIGEIFEVSSKKDCETICIYDKVKKKQLNDLQYIQELRALKKLQDVYNKDNRVVPILYDDYTCDDFGFFVIELLHPLRQNFIQNNILIIRQNAKVLLDLVESYGVLQVDCKPDNMMMRKKDDANTLVLIDLGFSVIKKDTPYRLHDIHNIVKNYQYWATFFGLNAPNNAKLNLFYPHFKLLQEITFLIQFYGASKEFEIKQKIRELQDSLYEAPD